MMKIPRSIIGLILTIIIVLFVLEFVIFPPLSAQIKHDTFTYQDKIDEYFKQHEENIEIQNEQNKFIGTWGAGFGVKIVFKRNGVGRMYGGTFENVDIEIPFTYQFGEQNTIEITANNPLSRDEGFSTDVYYYKFDNNKLSLIPQDGGKGMYLIKI